MIPPATGCRGRRACGTPAPGGSCRARARRSPARPSRDRGPLRAGPCRARPVRPAVRPAGRRGGAGGPRRAAWAAPGRCASPSAAPQANRCPVAALVTGPTRAEPGRARACSAAAWPTTSPTAPYSTRAPPPMGPSTAGPVSTPIRRVPPSIAAHRREGAEGRPDRPLGVVLVRLRRPEHGLQPSAGHRRHRPAQRLHLGDHRGQEPPAGHVAAAPPGRRGPPRPPRRPAR